MNEDQNITSLQTGRVERPITPNTNVVFAITEIVSTITNTPIKDLPPLYPEVDGEALNSIVTATTASEIVSLIIEFDYNGCRVVCRDNCRLIVELRNNRDPAP